MARPKKIAVHKSIKDALGYSEDQTDDVVIKDWKERTRRVCKPCWELKYCPYGPFVEQSPLLPTERAGAQEHNKYLQECVDTGMVGSVRHLSEEDIEQYKEWLDDDEMLLAQTVTRFFQDLQMRLANENENDADKINAWLGGSIPSIEKYRVNFDALDQADYQEGDFSPDVWNEIQKAIVKRKEDYKKAIHTKTIDERSPIEAPRLAWFKKILAEYNEDDHPEEIPEMFSFASCSIFGHICPVFFASEAITETTEPRRMGRRPLSFKTMMRIVRRDDYRCQHCKEKLQDDKVEFDHIIPVSKGGSSEEHNLRLTCFKCNRDKSDDFHP